MTIVVRAADLDNPQVIALIAAHQRDMLGASPPVTSFALDLSGLQDHAVSVLAAWDGPTLAAIGALKRLAPDHGELKSIRTAPAFLRRGIARQLLEALIDLARNEGLTRLSLETGSGEKFEPALALYRQRGFVNGPAFADYSITDFNQCLHLDL
ncbi:MAG: GNAT family N-acetyltransferase [Sphingomonadaceae bacterium]